MEKPIPPKPAREWLGPAMNRPVIAAQPEPRYWRDEDSPLPPEPLPRAFP